MNKKIVAFVLAGTMSAMALSGCGSSSSETSSSQSDAAGVSSAVSESTESNEGTTAAALDENEKFTLKIYGPGLLSSQGETGAVDMVTGLETPGYNVIVDRWNELHPNVTLDIEGAPWDSWQSAVQTAALSGDLDIILHGATLTSLVEPLDDYLASEPDFASQIYTTETRRTTDYNDLSIPTTTGIPYTLNPEIAYIDTQILKDYGVDLPDKNWTWEDLLEIAKKTTGTDPVTGKQTYGVQIDSMDNANNLYTNFQLIATAYDAKVFTYGKTVEDSTVDYTSDKSVKVFQMIQDLGQYCSPEVKEGVNISYALTADNDTAIRYCQNSYTHYEETETAGVSDRYLFLPMPVIEEGEHKGDPSIFKGCNNIAICNTSKHKDWAWEFIKFLVTDPTCVQWFIDCTQFPNATSGLDNVTEAMGDKAEPVITALKALPDDFSNSTTEYYNNVSFGPVPATLGVVTHDLVNDTTTAEEAAQTMQSTIEEYLNTQ